MADTRAELEETVRRGLAAVFPDDDVASIASETTLQDVLEVDSMAFVDLVLELERDTGVHVDTDDFEQLTSIRAIVDYLMASGAVE